MLVTRLKFMLAKERERKYIKINAMQICGVFFFFNHSLFLFCGDKLKPKRKLAQRYVNLTGKVAVFRQVSVEPSTSTISLNKKIIVVTGVNLVTEVEQP